MRTDRSVRRHLGGAQHNEGGRRRGRGKGPGGSARTLSPFGGRAVALVIIYPNGERELVAPVTEAEADALVAHLRLVSPRSTVLRAPCELKVDVRGAMRRHLEALAQFAAANLLTRRRRNAER